MSLKFINLFDKFITIGVYKKTTKNELKKIKLLNLYCGIWYVFFVIDATIAIQANHFILRNSSIVLISIIFVQVLHYLKKYSIARLFYISLIMLSTFIHCNFIDAYKSSFLEFLFVFPPCLSLIFFDNKKINITVLLLSFFTLFVPNIFFKHYPIHIFNYFNTAIFYFGIYIIISYFKNLNLKNEKILEKQKKELESINNFQSQFFINISHEIRTPITLIKGDIEQLEQYEAKTPDLKIINQSLHTEVNKITSMVDDVLDLSKIKSAKFNLNISSINCTELIQKLHASFETIFKQKNIDFKLTPITHNFIINADHIQLTRALSNIIVNASKYTDQQGEVTIDIKSNNNNVVISVTDTGIGILESDIDKICNQFYQVNNDINHSGGSGIGLSLTNEIINLHNGRLTIESSKGIGSTFTIHLPLKESSILTKTAKHNISSEKINSASVITPPTKNKNELFLVVDDNLKMRNYITRVLNKHGYRCLHAENGVEALELITKNNINFIITDYMMPKMNGYHFIKNLRAQKIDIPILMLTAKNDNKSKLDVFRLGIDDYLTKPFESNEFIIRVQNALKNYQNRTQYIHQQKIPNEEIEENNTWLDKVKQFIYNNCSDIGFKKANIAIHFNMSESSVFRKLKSKTGLSPNNFIKEVKLQKAREILENNPNMMLKQITLEVGFSHSSYFSKIYENRFGVKPCIQSKTYS